MVFLNKLLLSNLKFDFPLFMTWFQLVVALVCIYIAGYAGQQYDKVIWYCVVINK